MKLFSPSFAFVPVTLFGLLSFSLSCRSISSEQTHIPSFSDPHSGEEPKSIGDQAYGMVCGASLLCPKSLKRKDGDVAFTYGELVAFSADFYGNPEDMYEERRQRNLWAPLAKNAAEAKTLLAHDATHVEDMVHRQGDKFPGFNAKYLIAYPGYLELSAKNSDHFGWHNMKAYVKYHSQALAFAMEARHKTNDPRLLTKALFYNAFADHFLTDAFAMGHIRVPKAQGMSWGTRKGYSPESVGALAKLLHDHPEMDGLLVANARGDNWMTLPEEELLLPKRGMAARMLRDALSLSVKEVLAVYQGQAIPDGVFGAIELVPFVSSSERSLSSDFSPDISEDDIRRRYLEKLGPVWKSRVVHGLNTRMAREFFTDLPDLMDEFRSMVKADILDPELTRRLPQAYIDGYLNVR